MQTPVEIEHIGQRTHQILMKVPVMGAPGRPGGQWGSVEVVSQRQRQNNM